ncbi:MAG TPA: iron-containing alcohol dehydrogenase [Chloroflexota bacterium]|nr:iron-containing alcohol dehydrogenase [Chloroflexota bacterium]
MLRVGVGAHRLIPDEAARLGQRVLVVSDPRCVRIPEVAVVVGELRRRASAFDLFTDIPGEPTTDEVSKGLEALRRIAADVVVGIGGGSVLDTAKAVAAMATNPGTIADYMGRDKLVHRRQPLVLAPTTAGTGSEATRYTVITATLSRHQRPPQEDEPEAATTGTGSGTAQPSEPQHGEPSTKMLITDWTLLPDAAVVDPLLVVGSPPPVTAAAGVDALTHAIEAYVSQRRQPTADLFALGALRQLYPYLRRAFQDGSDLEARAQTAIGALHAGIAFCNASVALVHGMSRPIGARFHVPHGLANSMLLPAVTAWSLPGAPDRYRDVAAALGLAAAETLPEALARLSRDLGIPRLGEVVEPAQLRRVAPQMARDALASGSPQNNPRVPSESEIVELYERCL